MCKKYKAEEKLLPENIDVEAIADYVENKYSIRVELRFIKKIAIECKGCAKCFLSRLQGHVCNERFGENACLYHDWPKGFAENFKKEML
jgi:hypothetical protein